MDNPPMPGGYACFTTAQLWNLCRMASDKRLSLAAVRVFLACKEMLERRTGTTSQRLYGEGEIISLTNLSERTVAKGLAELHHHELVSFADERITIHDMVSVDSEEAPFGTAPNRLVPIPRRLVRILCAHNRKKEILVSLVHCARALFLRGERLVKRGAVKSSWIQSVFHIGRTVVTRTRAWLRSLGFLKPQEAVEQWRQNRYGYYYQILAGDYAARRKRQTSKRPRMGTPYKRTPFNKLKPNNQYYQRRSRPATGANRRSVLRAPPTIKNIHPEDLKRLSRLLPLFKQATGAGWLADSEASQINFVAAAIRASRAQGDSVRIFVGIVRKGLWHHITFEQEGRAAQALKRHRDMANRLASSETSRLVSSLARHLGRS